MPDILLLRAPRCADIVGLDARDVTGGVGVRSMATALFARAELVVAGVEAGAGPEGQDRE